MIDLRMEKIKDLPKEWQEAIMAVLKKLDANEADTIKVWLSYRWQLFPIEKIYRTYNKFIGIDINKEPFFTAKVKDSEELINKVFDFFNQEFRKKGIELVDKYFAGKATNIHYIIDIHLTINGKQMVVRYVINRWDYHRRGLGYKAIQLNLKPEMWYIEER